MISKEFLKTAAHEDLLAFFKENGTVRNKLTRTQIQQASDLNDAGVSYAMLGTRFGVSPTTVMHNVNKLRAEGL